ncbi:MAG: hypothetical protein LBF41_00285, partial [Deltaproteobacteria bacterium]|nr:hypothetical protein [Deltaproteobacteria bacterium]
MNQLKPPGPLPVRTVRLRTLCDLRDFYGKCLLGNTREFEGFVLLKGKSPGEEAAETPRPKTRDESVKRKGGKSGADDDSRSGKDGVKVSNGLGAGENPRPGAGEPGRATPEDPRGLAEAFRRLDKHFSGGKRLLRTASSNPGIKEPLIGGLVFPLTDRVKEENIMRHSWTNPSKTRAWQLGVLDFLNVVTNGEVLRVTGLTNRAGCPRVAFLAFEKSLTSPAAPPKRGESVRVALTRSYVERTKTGDDAFERYGQKEKAGFEEIRNLTERQRLFKKLAADGKTPEKPGRDFSFLPELVKSKGKMTGEKFRELVREASAKVLGDSCGKLAKLVEAGKLRNRLEKSILNEAGR